MVLSEGVLGLRRREYELERQAASHALEASRGQLAYLSTLVSERYILPFLHAQTQCRQAPTVDQVHKGYK